MVTFDFHSTHPFMKYTAILLLLVALYACKSPAGEKPGAGAGSLEAYVDSLVRQDFDSSRLAGMAIAVFKGDQQLLLKSYGSADLDLDVPLKSDASFEIGSVTKQFTAAAVLQLAEEGKLSLDDDFTKYVKFNTRGKKVTVRQLMNHTSGIKGYTEMEMFGDLSYQHLKRDTLLRIVEKEPFDFEPGANLIYNNTGFFLLGLVIEKVSGKNYEEYVKENLFAKAGMTNSYYGDELKVVKGRAHGYSMSEKGLVRANYLDHTWPYAAGSLCSTVEDLVKWNRALHHGKIMSDASYQEFLAPAVLNSGDTTRYAKGITVWSDNGTPVISHGGGIYGFLSENAYYPKDDVSVVVLVNTTGPVSPERLALQVGKKMFGIKPYAGATAPSDLAPYVGTFSGPGRGHEAAVNIIAKEGALWYKMGERPEAKLSYVSGNRFRAEDVTFTFSGDAGGFNTLSIDQIYGFLVLKRK